MNSTLASSISKMDKRASWVVVGVAFLVMYVPLFAELMGTLWATDQNAHGPIVLAVATWFFIYKARQLTNEKRAPSRLDQHLGSALIFIGLVSFIVGRSQTFYLLSVGSVIPLLAGLVLYFLGQKSLRHFWFAFFFLFFMIPMPGSVIDALTQPMKIAVSWGAEHLLYALGYPIARSGVILIVGPYQLLVADACAGLNSLFTLEALGLLYLNVMRHESALRNLMIALFIVPISFASNLTRVVVLALITYYLGDEAGQGFLHGFSGMVLFLTALILIILLDGSLRSFSSYIASTRVRG